MSPGPTAERCEICGQSNPSTLETHHIVPQRLGGSDYPENLVKLCGGCHNAIERIYDDSFYERLRINSERNVQFEGSEEAGEEAKPWEADSRQFPDSPKHVERVSMAPKRQWELGVLDEEVIEFETAAERIEHLKNEIKDYEEELEAEAESEPEQEFETETEAELETEEEMDVGFANQRAALQESLHIEADPIPPEERIESCERAIENVKDDFEADETIAIESEFTQVISCGYCNQVFAEYEPEAAARHIQLSHHIDDPYEAIGMSKDEAERIKTRLSIEYHFERFGGLDLYSSPGGRI